MNKVCFPPHDLFWASCHAVGLQISVSACQLWGGSSSSRAGFSTAARRCWSPRVCGNCLWWRSTKLRACVRGFCAVSWRQWHPVPKSAVSEAILMFLMFLIEDSSWSRKDSLRKSKIEMATNLLCTKDWINYSTVPLSNSFRKIKTDKLRQNSNDMYDVGGLLPQTSWAEALFYTLEKFLGTLERLPCFRSLQRAEEFASSALPRWHRRLGMQVVIQQQRWLLFWSCDSWQTKKEEQCHVWNLEAHLCDEDVVVGTDFHAWTFCNQCDRRHKDFRISQGVSKYGMFAHPKDQVRQFPA